MAKGFPGSWKKVLAILTISTGMLVLLVFVDELSPKWLSIIVGIIVFLFFVAAALASALPFLFFIALIPWHFIALHRGLIRRGRVPCGVSLSQGSIHVTRGDRLTSHALDRIVRARFARNDNWTESKMLEDALGLFASNGRELERLPESATGLAELLAELGARGIPVEQVYVSAPALLD